MKGLEPLKERLAEIERRLGYTFAKKELLFLAFIHRSFANEHREVVSAHNERLEFLGDSALGLVLSDYLYHRLPTYVEGQLSELRSRLVDASSCALYVQKLQLSEFILLGRGEKKSEGRAKLSILSDVFEALFGAIYLDGGLAAARAFFFAHFEEEVERALGAPSRNYKAELQDFSQKRFQAPPLYAVVGETGPDHAKIFHVMVSLQGEEMGFGTGASKKEAEQRAAFEALSKLEGKS